MIKKISIGGFAILLALLSFLLFPQQAHADCLSDAPSNVTITKTNGMNDAATLSWFHPGNNLDHFSLVYGLMPNSYQFGVVRIPKETRSFNIMSLMPGNTYYVRVWSYCDGNGSATWSNEVNILMGVPVQMQASTSNPKSTSMAPSSTATSMIQPQY